MRDLLPLGVICLDELTIPASGLSSAKQEELDTICNEERMQTKDINTIQPIFT